VTRTGSSSGLKVLLVDDNQDAADTLATLLGLWGHEVRVAYRATPALRMAVEDVPDCLISDIAMPGMDGYDLARRVRSEERLARVRLIALTSYSDDDHVRQSFEAGFEYILTKSGDPSELRELLTMMEKIKELASQTQELARQNVELVGETRDTLKEVNEHMKDVKKGVEELKNDVNELKKDVQELRDGQGETPAGG
jgi:two-component system, OmpR family, response regulator